MDGMLVFAAGFVHPRWSGKKRHKLGDGMTWFGLPSWGIRFFERHHGHRRVDDQAGGKHFHLQILATDETQITESRGGWWRGRFVEAN